jgi:hypothetical protein
MVVVVVVVVVVVWCVLFLEPSLVSQVAAPQQLF